MNVEFGVRCFENDSDVMELVVRISKMDLVGYELKGFEIDLCDTMLILSAEALADFVEKKYFVDDDPGRAVERVM